MKKPFIIFALFVFCFIWDDPKILPIFKQKYLIYALLIGLMYLRSIVIGEKKFNKKPFFISLLSLIVYILITYGAIFLFKYFVPIDMNNPDQINFYQNYAYYSSMILFGGLGALSFGFFYYYDYYLNQHGNSLYKIIEILIGASFFLYPFIFGKAWHITKLVVILILLMHIVYILVSMVSKIYKYYNLHI